MPYEPFQTFQDHVQPVAVAHVLLFPSKLSEINHNPKNVLSRANASMKREKHGRLRKHEVSRKIKIAT